MYKNTNTKVTRLPDKMKKNSFGLYGAGGFAREVMPWVNDALSRQNISTKNLFLIETNPSTKINNPYPLISEEDFLKKALADSSFNIAISDSKVRQKIAERLISNGITPLTLKSSHSIVYDDVALGIGAIICPQAIITANVVIGKFLHLNLMACIAHDCIIGDYVTFGPGAICCGNVHIQNHVYIGAGAIIKQGQKGKPLIIGEGAVIGMGAVVTKDVPANTIVIGNPARHYKSII